MRKTTLFKKYVAAPEILMLPVVHDALCAKIAARAGFKAIAAAAYATACTYVIARAVTNFFEGLARTGSMADFEGQMMHFEEFNNLVGLPEIRAAEKKYYQDVESCE